MYNFKVGGILLAKSECIMYCTMYGTEFRALIIGKEYRIRVVYDGTRRFKVLDEGGFLHSFPISNYGEFFYTDKEIRKLKLERLSNAR